MTRPAESHSPGATPSALTGVYAVLLLQSLMASGTHLVAKVVVNAVDAPTLTLIRCLVSVAGMAVLLLFSGPRVSIRREDYRLIFVLSLLAIPVNQFFFLYGIRFTTAANAALLYATTPALVLLLSRILLGERLTRGKVAGVALAFAGVLVVILERGPNASMEYVYGNVIIFLAVIAWSSYTVYGKRLIAHYGPIGASSVTLIVGTVLFIPVGIIPALAFPYEALSAANWLQILYLGIVTSVLAYVLWYYALSRAEAGKVALFTNLQPILTTVLAVLLLGQSLTVMFVLGGMITLSGVILAQFG
jgi:drug/metabolite transporter (DMT)-like permease